MCPMPLAPEARTAVKGPQDEAKLLAIVAQLVRESSPGRAAAVALDSSLERDLAIDSLARVELLLRIEKAFGVRLPADTLARAESVRDLLESMTRAAPAAAPTLAEPAIAAPLAEITEGAPDEARTLTATLLWHVARHPDRTHILFYREPEQTEPMTYRQLYEAAKKAAGGLRDCGIGPGEAVAIMLPTCLEFFAAFYGALFAGAVPVPLYPPTRRSQLEDHLRRQAGILASCQAPILVTMPEARPLTRMIRPLAPRLRRILTPAELAAGATTAAVARPRASDTALLQYTSGSTGNPKGVVLTHANLLANIRAWSQRVRIRPDDVCVSWLPLYHDMGLIGAWLGSLYDACLLVLMSPLAFLSRPEQWLWTIHRHRGTLTAAPNFAFELLLRRHDEATLAGLDLRSWRMCANGAEPVSPDTVTRFAERFGPHGFRAEAMTPVYGLAECAVGLTVSLPGVAPRIDRIEREPFLRDGLARPAGADAPEPLRFVGCGTPLAGHEVRIVDAHGNVLPDRRAGRIEFRGPSATSGYFRNPEETARLFRDGWLDSGDLGYLADGEVYPTGRVKDMITRGGHNLYPNELEEAIGALPGIRKGCVAIFGSRDPRAATERLVVVAETRSTDDAVRFALEHRINELAVTLLGTPADEVVLAPPHSVLKTSSGKIRRSATREAYEAGSLGRAPRAPWLQLLRLAARGAADGLRGHAANAGSTLYAVYARAFFTLMSVALAASLLVVPRGAATWATCRRFARMLLAGARVRVESHGLDRIPLDGPVVFASNHASYIDGLALLATLPRPVVFVAKQELQSASLVRFVLRRLAARFVERFATQESVEDARRLGAAATAGEPLFFFAEGTFRDEPGLLPFHLGAFLAAAESGTRLVPIALRGTRAVLRGDEWRPHWGEVSVTAGPPLAPAGDDWHAALGLRDAARQFIVAHCGEPDCNDVS
jgi:acyl carrier protein